LKEIAAGLDETLSHLIAVIDADRQNPANLSSAIRLFVLGFYHDHYAESHSRTRKQLVA
jgi:predicted DNA-binding ribbon-helix-helix protein